MHPAFKHAGVAALMLAAAARPALADSLGASSAAGGSSASSASSASSTSSEKSSDGSSNSSKKTTVVEGPYRIIDVAALPERPGTVRLQLQALADAGPEGRFFLYLPEQAFERSRLGAGQTVTARQRPYGTEFARFDTQQAFFLVLDDDWYRELASNPVVL